MSGVIRRGVLLSVILTVPAALVAAQRAEPRPAAPAVCRDGQRDDFNGAALDRSRWATVVRESPGLRLEKGYLVLPTENTDLIWADDPPEKLTRNIVLQPLPQGPFTATAKVVLPARQAYQQAGLTVYGDDDNYAKMVFQARGDSAHARAFEFLREDSGQPLGRRSDPLGAAYPDTVWVRLTSDTRFLRASYSSDGASFTDMPQSESLEGIANPKIGIISMAGSRGEPEALVIDAKFDWFEICPGPGAAR